MKTPNSVSQKIRILHKINKKSDVRLLKVRSFLCTQYLVGFCMNYCINSAWREDNQSVALFRCNEDQVALIAVFSSSALLGLVSLIFLLTILQRFSMRFRSGEFAGRSSTVTHGHWTSFWYLWQCGQVPSPAGKWNQHIHEACQQKQAWSALKCPGRWLRWLWTSENTVDQHQQMTWQPKSSLTVETSHWTILDSNLYFENHISHVTIQHSSILETLPSYGAC